MIARSIDKLVGLFSPQAQLQRVHARALIDQVNAITGGSSGYAAARTNRLTRHFVGSEQREYQIPRDQISVLRKLSWDLFRNNGQARKIIRHLESKVIGPSGPEVQSLAMMDGEPHTDFRVRAREVYNSVADQMDYRGKPGKGGQHLSRQYKTALKSVILNGDAYAQIRPLMSMEQKEKGLLLPIQLQLIHASRLDYGKTDDGMYYGIEFNDDGTRKAYWFNTGHSSEVHIDQESKPTPADQIIHLYMEDDVDQVSGAPWFGAALLKMKESADYEYNELVAAAMGACYVIGFRQSAGQSGGLSNQLPSDWTPTDLDGNALTGMQPGQMVNLGQNGEIDGFNPGRPNQALPEFLGHLGRSTANAVPGVKGSTVTGDYRRSSFSSERSADNDIWPEIEGLQHWFYNDFCQPIYEEIVEAGINAGKFEGVITAKVYDEHRVDLLPAQWQGPVGRSIKPSEDAIAAKERIRNGTSSPQIEAAKLGKRVEDVVEDWSKYFELAKSKGIPEEVALQAFLDVSGSTQISEVSKEVDDDQVKSEAEA